MIKAQNLTMHYGSAMALNDVSFDVREGEIVGLLGPNGAGKSTTMKILTTYLHPSKGTALVGGVNVLENPREVRRMTGYLPEVLPLYMDMEVRGYLQFVGQMRGLLGQTLRDRTETALDMCGLRPVYRRVIRELSKGYRQRTALAQALIHDPKILILDEPTSGLDPHQIIEIRQLVKRLAADKTVILSTHILQEVETTADRIVIINQGEIVGNGTFDELRARATTQERAHVSVRTDSDKRADIQREISGIQGVSKVDCCDEKNGAASFVVTGKVGAGLWREIGQLARAKHWEVWELTNKPLTLEETFLSLTEPDRELETQRGAVA